MPDSQIMPAFVPIMLNQPSNPKLISGSPDGLQLQKPKIEE